MHHILQIYSVAAYLKKVLDRIIGKIIISPVELEFQTPSRKLDGELLDVIGHLYFLKNFSYYSMFFFLLFLM